LLDPSWSRKWSRSELVDLHILFYSQFSSCYFVAATSHLGWKLEFKCPTALPSPCSNSSSFAVSVPHVPYSDMRALNFMLWFGGKDKNLSWANGSFLKIVYLHRTAFCPSWIVKLGCLLSGGNLGSPAMRKVMTHNSAESCNTHTLHSAILRTPGCPFLQLSYRRQSIYFSQACSFTGSQGPACSGFVNKRMKVALNEPSLSQSCLQCIESILDILERILPMLLHL
jgi:hypothetical protein